MNLLLGLGLLIGSSVVADMEIPLISFFAVVGIIFGLGITITAVIDLLSGQKSF